MSRPCPDHANLFGHGIRQCPKCMKSTKPRCKRCNKLYHPRWLKELRSWAQCCTDCGVKNILDCLGLPTPPELLDRHTKRPTLSQEEYRKELHNKDDDANYAETFGADDE